MRLKKLNDYLNKIFFIVSKFGKKKNSLFRIINFTSMILEVFSIGLIIPVLSVIENKGF